MSWLRGSKQRLARSSSSGSSGSSSSDSGTESSDGGFPSAGALAAEETRATANVRRLSCVNKEEEDAMSGVDIYNGELGTKQYIFFFRARSLYQQMRIKRDKINMPGGYGQLEFLEMDMPQLLGQDPQRYVQRYLQEHQVIRAAVAPARVHAMADRAATTA